MDLSVSLTKQYSKVHRKKLSYEHQIKKIQVYAHIFFQNVTKSYQTFESTKRSFPTRKLEIALMKVHVCRSQKGLIQVPYNKYSSSGQPIQY